MLPAFTDLFLCQLLGEMLAAFARLPLPGTVVGMAILFLAFLLKGPVTPTAPHSSPSRRNR